LKNGTTSIRVPNEIDAKTISLEKAIELIEIKKEKDLEKKKKTKKKK
jgi:topoisomerase IA-like protein